jgi:hypothetical protein
VIVSGASNRRCLGFPGGLFDHELNAPHEAKTRVLLANRLEQYSAMSLHEIIK